MQKTHQESVESFKKSLAELQLSMAAKKEQKERMEDVERLSHSLNQLAHDYEQKLADLKRLYHEREEDIKSIASAKSEEVELLKRELETMHARVQEVFGENVEVKKKVGVKTPQHYGTNLMCFLNKRQPNNSPSVKEESLVRFSIPNGTFKSIFYFLAVGQRRESETGT